MTNRFLDHRLARHPAYTTMLMWWMGARAEHAAIAQLIAITAIWRREQATMFPDAGKRSAP